ncbi:MULTISPECIES: EAL domain-containing protein [Thioclava]|uniref:EAL domain-containing protein n=1 Tax=Thioclava litoralis TaxID=3076557 RepID=A0ABZ1DW58_9RHOB|nr:EAL domain-containing protein [Thioclava sp. FTW29]
MNADFTSVLNRSKHQTIREAVVDTLKESLSALRDYLGMETIFVSEIEDGRLWFLTVDEATPFLKPLIPGNGLPLNDTLCYWVCNDILPHIIQSRDPIMETVRHLRDDENFDIGIHVSFPIHIHPGLPFGTICCFSRKERPPLTDVELRMFRTMAEMISANLRLHAKISGLDEPLCEDLAQTLRKPAISPVFQPIKRFEDGHIIGYEGLSRFQEMPQHSPQDMFALAQNYGMGPKLELNAANCILDEAERLNLTSLISINHSPDSLLAPSLQSRFEAYLEGNAQRALAVEISEQAVIQDFARLGRRLDALRALGVKIALDDVGQGNAGLAHILALKPDLIKLDRVIVAELANRKENRAMVSALLQFSKETGCELIAEGIETEDEKAILMDLGVKYGQGFYLGRPAPLPRQH